MTAFTGLRFRIWTPWCPLVTKEYVFYFYSSSSFLSWDIIQAKIPHQKKTVGLEAVLSGSWRGWPTMLLAWLVIKQVWEDTQHDITDRIPITVGYPAWHHWHQHTHHWQFLSGESLYFLLACVPASLPCGVGLLTEDKSGHRNWNLLPGSNSLDRIEQYQKKGTHYSGNLGKQSDFLKCYSEKLMMHAVSKNMGFFGQLIQTRKKVLVIYDTHYFC